MFRNFLFFMVLSVSVSSIQSVESVARDRVLDLRGEQLGGDFTLRSSRGEFSLEQLRGKVVVLFFGYTKCPDVCPSSLALLSQALNELSEEELQQVQGVFISVDPKRDTFQALDDYVSYFHPNLIGVTGSESEVAKVAKLYGAQYVEVKLEASAFAYAVDHSATTYLISPQGELRFLLPHQTPSVMMLEAIRYLLAER
ncbi:MAG: SCO family protein [Candidatus Thiodiazotropha taylori]|nr:SCO family protein [Candidatus Thiodiazotropha endolucinida]MCG7967292.1 SCO family protein [Candidatus Thiodiazotropha taylori]MCG8051488.1 SCO family protein [Candidatus Thiodiazotropha taylori]MCW4229033.1 SCO family protein [Candidatus Thiodiazotropha taylori]MCW4258605.1 SCO family protein [Candidatus Thiodiazotropha taylori]